MCTLMENVSAHLRQLGFEPDDTIEPDNVDDYMSYAYFNGFTLLIDDNGQGWKAEGTVNPGTQFRLRHIEIVE